MLTMNWYLVVSGFECRCGNVFCGLHRYSDKHDCTFDYKAEGRAKITKDNPVILAEKIQKIWEDNNEKRLDTSDYNIKFNNVSYCWQTTVDRSPNHFFFEEKRLLYEHFKKYWWWLQEGDIGGCGVVVLALLVLWCGDFGLFLVVLPYDVQEPPTSPSFKQRS